MIQKCALSLALLTILFAAVLTASAQAQPVVFAVLFYSPSCGHCHHVITETLPALQAEFGAAFKVMLVDVSAPGGGDMLFGACAAFNVPDNRCGYVPTLVIGSTVLIGSGDIPAQLPTLVREGLEAGGLGLPAIPGLREAYEAAEAVRMATQSAFETETAPAEAFGEPAEPLPTIEEPVVAPVAEAPSWQERFARDPLANGIAVVVLGILTASIVAQLVNGVRQLARDSHPGGRAGRAEWAATLGVAALGTLIAASLVLEQQGLTIPTVLAAIVALILATAAAVIWLAGGRPGAGGVVYPAWLLPLVVVSGLLVAGYMAYVEVTQTDAVCGAVGDCNTVQQSAYAKLVGILPIGVFGVIGYLMILGAWRISQSPNPQAARLGRAGLLALALFGVAFSTYLTFLEPFVIGATCAWCLTSAMQMALLLWLQAAPGWAAVSRLLEKPARWQFRPNQPDW